MLIFIIAIASYGRIIFEETILYGVENAKKQHDLNRIIVSIKYPLAALEGKLYRYLISLDDTDKDYIPLYIFELKTQLEDLKGNAIINENKAFHKHLLNLEKDITQLKLAYKTLAKFSRLDRYPITKIIDEKLNPTSKLFFSAIQTLLDKQDELIIDPNTKDIRQQVQELRYIVVQILGSTRLLFVTKTGIFGSNAATLDFILKNQRQYQSHLNMIVKSFKTYLLKHQDDIDLEIEIAINELLEANSVRENIFDEIVNSLHSDQWRQDLYFMEHTLKPILNDIQAEINLMERRLEKQSSDNTFQTQEASNLLSDFLWLFVALIVLFFMAIYFSIDKWLRTPLIKISNAMNFERGEVSGNALKIIGLKEIDNVISAFNLMRKEIKIRQQRLSYILQNLGEGIIVVNQQGKIDSFNATAEDIFKTTEVHIKTKKITQLLNIHSIESDIEWLSNIQNKATNEHLNYFLDGQRSDGGTFKCDVTVSHMKLNKQHYAILVAKDASNRLANQRNLEHAKDKAEEASKQFESQVIQLDRSMTELKETQQQLIESEKNASLAGLVAGVAHEINTPIGVSVTASSHLGDEIKTLSQRVDNNQITKTDLDDFIEDAKEASNIIDSNLQRAAELVKSFKRVAVDQTSNETRAINLRSYFDEILLSLRPKLKKTAHEIHNNIDESINITTSPGALSQIFTNLIFNSLIHGFENMDCGNINIGGTLIEGVLSITYQDNGKGMKQSHRKKIFEPFFTTKRGEGGSGLGMHIVYNLVTQSLQGTICCDSEEGEGCLFTLEIPIK